MDPRLRFITYCSRFNVFTVAWRVTWFSWINGFRDFIRLVHCFYAFTGFVFAWVLWFQRFGGFMVPWVWFVASKRHQKREIGTPKQISRSNKISYFEDIKDLLHSLHLSTFLVKNFFLLSPAGEHCLYITHNPTFTYLYLIITTWLYICVVVSSYSWFKFYFIFIWSMVCIIIW